MQDKKLIAIIREYVWNKQSAHGQINVDEMVRDIMHRHREYGRKQIKPFTKYLKEAYDHVCHYQNASYPSTNDKSPVSYAAEVKRKSPPEETEHNSKRLRLEGNQCSSIQDRKPFIPGVDLMNAMMVERYKKMHSITQSPSSSNHASRQVMDAGSLFVIDRTGSMSVAPGDGCEPDVPVADAKLPADEPIYSQREETDSVISTGKSPLQDKTDECANPVLKIASTEKEAATKASSPVRKKKKTQRKNEDDLNEALNWKNIFEVKQSLVRFEDYPGLMDMLSELNIKEIFYEDGPQGVILTGPKGCGKSTLAEAIVGELQIPFIHVEAWQLTSSQNKNRELFDDLVEQTVANSPCALIIEDLPKKRNGESSRSDDLLMEQLMALFAEKNKKQIWIIATTLSITSVDEVLIGDKGFRVEVDIGLPKNDTKIEILKEIIKRRGINLEPELNFRQVVLDTPAYVACDLKRLVNVAVRKAKMRNYREKKPTDELMPKKMGLLELCKNAKQLDDVTLTLADFKLAVKDIKPAAKYSAFFTESPNVKWDEDIGGMEQLRKEFHYNFVLPVTKPELYEELKISCKPTGFLLHGPPGCGKTLVAKAMATEACMNFMTVNGPELLRKYVGDSELMVRELFEKARKAAPCIVFFDEIDSLCEKRDNTEAGAKVNVVNQILPILDGIYDRGNVYVIGSTNRINNVDPALLRPGRFDKHYYVGLPNAEQRHKILLAITKKGTEPALADDVNLEELANDPRCENLSGADLYHLIRQAALNRIEQLEEGDTGERVTLKANVENTLNWIVGQRKK